MKTIKCKQLYFFKYGIKVTLLTVLLVFTLETWSSLEAQEVKMVNGIDAVFEMPKDEFVIGEPVYINVIFKNNRNEKVILYLFPHRIGFNFKVMGENKTEKGIRKLVFFRDDELLSPDSILIASGSMFSEKFLFNKRVIFEKEGTYRIKCELNSFVRLSDGTLGRMPPPQRKELMVTIKKDKKQLEKIYKSLMDTAINGKSSKIRKEAALALSYTCNEFAVPFLKKVVNQGDFSAAKEAIYGFRRIGNYGFKRIHGVKATKALIEMLEHKNPEIVRIAHEELSKMRELTDDSRIISLIDRLKRK